MGVHASPQQIREMLAPAFSENRPASARGPHRCHVATLRELVLHLLAGIRTVRPQVWWLLLFACLLLAFGLALVVQPTVGRGGR